MKIQFKPDTHQYFDNENQEMISWSALSKAFFPSFDAEAHATRLTDNEEDKQIKLKEWALKGTEACDFGTAVHEYAEWCVLDPNKAYELFSETEQGSKLMKYMIGVNKFMNDNIVLGTEIIVGSKEYKVAGTFDALVKLKDKLALVDYKSNDKTEAQLKNSWGKKGYGPCSFIPASTYNKYELQLSMYRYLAELSGQYSGIDDMYIVHIKENEYVMYKCSYKRSVVKAMLEMYKQCNYNLTTLQNILSNTQEYIKPTNKKIDKVSQMKKITVNAARWGMCFNRAHEEFLKIMPVEAIQNITDELDNRLLNRANYLYKLTTQSVEELESELTEEANKPVELLEINDDDKLDEIFQNEVDSRSRGL